MKKVFTICLMLITYQCMISQNENIPKKRTQNGFAKIDFLSIKMPITTIPDEQNMGFTGIHYNLTFNNLWYTGVGLYGAVSGNRGGFFTLGVNAGIKKEIYKNIYLDTGFHFGGGGGAGAPDGGGAFILPHVNLGYNFKNFSINTGYSYVNFFDNGLIKGHQLNVGLEIPLNFNYSYSNNKEKEYDINELKQTTWNATSKRNAIMFHFNNLNVLSDAKASNGEILKGKTINLAGFEFSSYLNKNWFTFVKVDGAYNGIRAGYMDVLVGAGYLANFNKNRIKIAAKFGIGAGGGGGVDTKGGFLLYPDISLEQRLFNDIYVSLNKGYLLTPNKDFYTSTFGLGIKYYVNRNGVKLEENNFKKAKFKGLDVIVKHDVYFSAERETDPTENMHQISLQVNLDLNKNFFIAAQTSFANFGNAGAYGEGLLGLGAKTNMLFNNTTSFFTQFIGGAAGGGNISTGEGLIFKPSAGVNYKVSNTLNLRAAGGFVSAKGGTLSSPFINFGISYHLSFLKLK